jgi:ribosome recycling factor
MKYDFSVFEKRVRETNEWLSRELSAVRTGRATPELFDGVRIESYGAQVPISHIAGVTVEDARTIRITPWDKGQIRDTEQSLREANLGVSIIVDDKGIRVAFPELTGERRQALTKIAKGKTEEARVSLRRARDEAWSEIQEKEKAGTLSEDEKFKAKDDLQKIVDTANALFDGMTEKKEKNKENERDSRVTNSKIKSQLEISVFIFLCLFLFSLSP